MEAPWSTNVLDLSSEGPITLEGDKMRIRHNAEITKLKPEDQDWLDGVLEDWRKERPDIDWKPLEIIARIQRAALFFEDVQERVAASYGLAKGELLVLGTLRRAGPPFELSPGSIGKEVLSSSGVITKRVDRLVELGFVERERGLSSDRRSVVIKLTPRGHKVAGAELDIAKHLECRAISVLSEAEHRRLVSLLRKVLVAIERRVLGKRFSGTVVATQAYRSKRLAPRRRV
jgi:DNA-binding MarR family transcriptional regulator